jgi:hypothetical protein
MKTILFSLALITWSLGVVLAQQFPTDNYKFEVDFKPYKNLVDSQATLLIDTSEAFYDKISDETLYNFYPNTAFQPVDGGFRFYSVGYIVYDNGDMSRTLNRDTFLWMHPFTISHPDTRAEYRFLNNPTSRVSYQFFWPQNEAMLCIQYRNLSYNDSLPNDSINFQVRIYKNGTIEYHYGPIYIENLNRVKSREQADIPDIKFYEYISNDGHKEAYQLYGDESDPSLIRHSALTETLKTLPKPGRIYRWVYHGPLLTGLFEHFQPKVKEVSYNEGNLYINGKNLHDWKSIEIIDLSGRKIFQQSVNAGLGDFLKIQLPLKSSIYIVKVTAKNGGETSKKFLVN